jgi:hypothetical protein
MMLSNNRHFIIRALQLFEGVGGSAGGRPHPRGRPPSPARGWVGGWRRAIWPKSVHTPCHSECTYIPPWANKNVKNRGKWHIFIVRANICEFRPLLGDFIADPKKTKKKPGGTVGGWGQPQISSPPTHAKSWSPECSCLNLHEIRVRFRAHFFVCLPGG